MNNAAKNTETPKAAAPAYQNRVTLVGYLGKAPELHEGRAVLSLATKVSWPAKDGKGWEQRTDWHRVTVWSPLAEAVRGLATGDHVIVEGELRSSLYHKEVGVGVDTVSVPITSWEIRARSVRKIAPRKKAQKDAPVAA